MKLTDEDLKVYEVYERLYSLSGFCPTTREVQKEMGYKSTDTPHHHIVRLMQAGYISQSNLSRARLPIHQPRIYYRKKDGTLGS